MVQNYFSATWGSQATNISATTNNNSGFDVTYTATSTGETHTTAYSFDELASLMEIPPEGTSNGIEASMTFDDNADNPYKNVVPVVATTADVNTAVWAGAKIAMKESGSAMKVFTGPGTAIGAIVGAGSAIYDMKTNPHPNYWKDGAQIGLGALAAVAEFTGAGEVWDWIGFGATAVSVGLDIYDLEHDN